MREKKRKEKKKRKKETSKHRKTTTTTLRCRYSSFNHPKHAAFFSSSSDDFVPTFLSSIELFAFSTSNENQKKNEANEQASSAERGAPKILSIDALDRASFSVIRKCTMADVLNAHFVHEYVKEDEEKEGKKKKELSIFK